MPENRALARARINKNHGEPIHRPGYRPRSADVHTIGRQAFARESACRVVSETADIAGPPAEPGAGDDGRRHLAACMTVEVLEPVFRTRRRMGCGNGDIVHAVLAQSYYVEVSRFWIPHCKGDSHLAIILTFAFLLRIVQIVIGGLEGPQLSCIPAVPVPGGADASSNEATA